MQKHLPTYWIDAPPTDGRMLATEERKIALASWPRIAAADGSTVAYVPTETLAAEIIEALCPGSMPDGS